MALSKPSQLEGGAPLPEVEERQVGVSALGEGLQALCAVREADPLVRRVHWARPQEVDLVHPVPREGAEELLEEELGVHGEAPPRAAVDGQTSCSSSSSSSYCKALSSFASKLSGVRCRCVCIYVCVCGGGEAKVRGGQSTSSAAFVAVLAVA